MLKINISKTGNGEELRKTLNSLESEGLISSEQSKKMGLKKQLCKRE